jgi:hypothetical protein
MGIKVPSVDEVKRRFTEAIPVAKRRWAGRIDDIVAGIEKAKSDAAEKNFAAAMDLVVRQKRRQAGLKTVKAEDVRKVLDAVGERRLGEGLELKADKQAANVAPYLETLAGIDLPPRKPVDTGTENLERVAKIAAALRAKKKALSGMA